jgi:hypothetical protein
MISLDYKLAFVVEISLEKAWKDNSEIQIKNKGELLYALMDKEIFGKLLDQGAEAREVREYIKKYLRNNCYCHKWIL